MTETVASAVERFIAHKRAHGRKYHSEARELALLVRFAAEHQVRCLRELTPALLEDLTHQAVETPCRFGAVEFLVSYLRECALIKHLCQAALPGQSYDPATLRQSHDPATLSTGLANRISVAKAAGAKVMVSFGMPAATAPDCLSASAAIGYHPAMVVSDAGSNPGTRARFLSSFSEGKATGSLDNRLIADSFESAPAETSSPWAQLAMTVDMYLHRHLVGCSLWHLGSRRRA